MPALENPRHERFAQAFFNGLANGITQGEAYRAAGYKPVSRNSCDALASRLMSRIVKRVAELQEEQNERLKAKLDLSKERVGRRLDKASQIAEQQQNASAMATSELGIAKVFGHITDKQEATLRHENANAPAPANSADIAASLLRDVGLERADEAAQAKALQAYDTLIASLEQIRDDSLGLSRTRQ